MSWIRNLVPFGRGSGQGKSGKAQDSGSKDAYDKSKHMEFGCSLKPDEERGTEVELGRLQRDLAGSYYWSGGFCQDFVFFVANWHPLLGMCCSHPLHPWTKGARIATFFLSCGLSMLPSALIVSVEAHAEREDVELLWGVLVFVCVTVPIIIWEVILYWVSVSDMFCRGRCSSVLPCIASCKRCCFMASLFMALVLAGCGLLIVYLSKATMYQLFLPMASGRVQSWILWFPIWTFLPYVGFAHGWYGEHTAAQRVHAEELS
eukprot:CAMPEP_0179060206 /NCGR_PEP_ID=MMETSP0796-20121207/25746_1 /TAXON_ID=73915 /ORGANISM="Pyrodinium bahamense, Strain pbaha01" /LENGTH=260 /DNA_ID=CAMNT_0020756981 /DNA_START=55 /DNA_END=837 /DNA_ORIENTATION=-